MALRPVLAVGVVVWGLCGCVTRTPGHEQSLMVSLAGQMPRAVRSAALTIASAQLQPCEAYVSPFASGALDALGRWLVPTAHAHSASNALRIGVPRSISLMQGGGATVDLGRFRAPEGRYCRVQLELGPADTDAVGLATDGGVDVGESLRVEFDDTRGAWRSTSTRLATVSLRPPLEIGGPPVPRTVMLRVNRDLWPLDTLGNADAALTILSGLFEYHH